MKKKILCVLFSMLFSLFLSTLPAEAIEAASGETAEDAYFNPTSAWTYTLHHEVTLHNRSNRPAYDIEVRIPLMDAHLPLYVDKIGEQLQPYPAEITTETDGQRVAVYRFPTLQQGAELRLQQSYALDVSSLNYTFDWTSLNLAYSNGEQLFLSSYLQPESLIQSKHAEIIAFAQKAVGNESNPYRKAQQIFSAVNLALDYSDGDENQDALSSLRRKSAHCEGYTNLYTACLRAVGIPARIVSGYLYIPEKHVSSTYIDPDRKGILMDSLRHVWVEFYLPETGWVIADPTFTYTYSLNNTVQKFVDWSYFANISTSRRYIFFSYGDSGEDKYQISHRGGDISGNFSARLVTGKDYLPFNDLQGHWAAEAVTYGVEQAYFNGITADAFAPDANMTRAMFVAVLGRLYQARGGQLVPYQANLSQFLDVQQDGYYTDALGWAMDRGLIDGYGNGCFGPNDAITRQQMAKIIALFAELLQAEQAVAVQPPQVVLAFPDLQEISSWAMNGVEFCVGLGLITGHDDGFFRPDDYASRAQVAAILQRIDTLIR
ncbi:MAG: S-layer homology domain-containing protein [Bacillota bacterium]|nr:S-layer homology domain-containing protein [Bacillota bacterium]